MQQDLFFGYNTLDELTYDLKHDGGVRFLRTPHALRGGDVVVLPDNPNTGRKIGLVVWNATDGRTIIVRDPQYNSYTNVEASDWKYTGVRSSRLDWMVFWKREREKEKTQ